MMTDHGQRESGEGRLAVAAIRCMVTLAAVAGAVAASSFSASAQDGWAPVVVAVAPPQDPGILAGKLPTQPRARPVPRPTASPPPASQPLNETPVLAAVTPQPAATPERRPTTADPAEGDPRLAREYCLNIADAAADARLAWQKRTLADLEQEIAKRVELLDAKVAEYQRWLARRDEFSKKAQDSVVTIYARMKPDAAAAQLVAMDEETAAAILAKLDPRNASAILNDMEATHAARLTATISGAANVNLPGRPKQPSGDKRS